ncbi:MAG: ABC transporter ATP-binding protein [Mycobacteriaceae bacterium]
MEVQNLSKQFGSINAVTDITFSVQPGTVTGFLGPNGSGKTTTLRMILGLIEPTSGTARIGGVPFNTLAEPARAVGAVLDSLSLHPRRTALNHLLVYTAAIGVPDSRAREVLQLVGLESAADRKAGTFSLGMRQRLALATALLGDPQILVLDEPANGLDPEGIAWLRDFLKSLAQSGRTVLISSHLLREIEQTVDHVIIVSRGALMYQGSVESLRRQQQTRILTASSDPVGLARALAAAGIPDTHITNDGRLSIANSDNTTILQIATQTGITIFGTTDDSINLEQIFLNLTAGQYAAQPINLHPNPALGYSTAGTTTATTHQTPSVQYDVQGENKK